VANIGCLSLISLIEDYCLSTLGATQSALNSGLKKLLTLSSVGATGPNQLKLLMY